MMDARFNVIDDDAQQASATRDALRDLGCNPVAWATNRQEAERIAAKLAPELLVVDARLHGPVDGIALAKRLRAQHRASRLTR
jgi:DNA-binding response OmpR family regulator